MLSREENEKLSRVGPGTPMGELLRRYWYPVAASVELKEAGTKAVKILGESLVLYRDKGGRLGLIGDTCPHRRTPLLLGIPEEDGLRCAYHGWKFNEAGRCLEQPAEPPESTFKDRVTIAAYPVEEMGGLIFAYLGPKPVPLLPRWDLFVMDNALRSIGERVIPCNWLQVMENALDPVHSEWLHGHFENYVLDRLGRAHLKRTFYHHVKIGFDVFEHGIIQRRMLEGQTEEDDDWKIGHPLVFPHILRSGTGGRSEFQYRVPIDDTNTYHVWYTCFRFPVKAGIEVPKQETIPLYEVPLPGLDEHGRPQWQLLESTSGADIMVWYTQGLIADRSLEKLGESDRGIILYRKLLKEEMEKVQRGEDPMNVFRDPAKNVHIKLPQEENKHKRGRYHFVPGNRPIGGATYYSPIMREVEELYAKYLGDRASDQKEKLHQGSTSF